MRSVGMTQSVICLCGHEFPVSAQETATGLRCPECGRPVEQVPDEHSQSTVQAKSLWSVMHKRGAPAQSGTEPEQQPTQDSAPDAEGGEAPTQAPSPSEPPTEPQPSPKGLWALMGRHSPGASETPTAESPDGDESPPNGNAGKDDPPDANASGSPHAGSESETASADDAARPPRGKSLWAVMHRTRGGAVPSGASVSPETPETQERQETQETQETQERQETQPAATEPVETQPGDVETEAAATEPASPSALSTAADLETGTEEESPPAAPKGLWSLMGTAPPLTEEPPTTEHASDDEPASTEAASSPPPVSSLRESGDHAEIEEPPPVESSDFTAATTSGTGAATGATTSEELDDEFDVAPLDDVSEFDDFEDTETEDVETTAAKAETRPKPVLSRGAKRALLLGIIAVPASALSLLPEFWVRIPANLLGFFALLVGLMAVSEIRSSRGRQRGQVPAFTGAALGALAMLLGPFVFTELGVHLRRRFGRQRTFDNLQQVGEALNRYHDEQQHFPPGGLHRRDEKGNDVPLHNWMTLLLPYLGDEERAVFSQIDRDVPYNHPQNLPAMRQNVPAFFASGSSRKKTPAGMAVTHFVALGGQTDVEGVGRVNVGIFSRNSRVTRDDVTDGFEQTLIAGEIAFDFPAWGKPGEYRRIGKGLNMGRDGFGNADRTGAMFLRADGSVRFYSNDVDRDVLQKMITRDGREHVEPVHYR